MMTANTDTFPTRTALTAGVVDGFASRGLVVLAVAPAVKPAPAPIRH
jgi:hypothetical protein